MSIRHYNPGRNRRGRVSIAAERFLYTALFASMATQVAFLYNRDSHLILISGICAAIFSLSHAQLAFAKRYFWTYLIFTLFFATLIEVISINTAWPFGQLKYTHLGQTIFGIPLLVLVFWLGAVHPLLLMARKIAPNWVLLSGAAAIASYALFFDQMLEANKFKKWHFTGAHVPFQTHIPLSNLMGWLFVGVIFFGIAQLILPKDRRKISASFNSIDIFLIWTWVYNFIANAFYFGRPGTALIGGLAFGALLLPYLSARYLGQP